MLRRKLSHAYTANMKTPDQGSDILGTSATTITHAPKTHGLNKTITVMMVGNKDTLWVSNNATLLKLCAQLLLLQSYSVVLISQTLEN